MRGGREGGRKQGEDVREPEGEGRQRDRDRQRERKRQRGSGPGLSLAKVEAFASCQLETAALGQKDAALHYFCRLVRSSVFVCLYVRTAWML